MMKNIQSENHHWWPKCVSKHWANDEGVVHWIKPNGEIIIAPPHQFGCLNNGHLIKLGRKAGDVTPLDQNFESEFNAADSAFPKVIKWLKSLEQKEILEKKTLAERYIPQNANDEELQQLIESVVSLVIRGPMQRETAVSVAEAVQGRKLLPKQERRSLIGINMRDSQKNAVAQMINRGKFAILYSPEREFIFGDGFFHNVRSPVQPYQLNSYKMLVPITATISVLYVTPRQYVIEPRIFTLVISSEEARALNDTIQIYSRDCIFYKSQKPRLIPDYKVGQHMQYEDQRNPVDTLISKIPGIRHNPHYFF